jgi:hypothetical protein
LHLFSRVRYFNAFHWIFSFLTIMLPCYGSLNILTRFTEFLSNFRRKMKTSKDKYQKKMTEMLNVKIPDIETLKGYITSEDEDIQPFFSSIFFCVWCFGFLCFFSFDIYFWYISFRRNSNKFKSFKFNFFRGFWHDVYDQVAPFTLKK